MLNSAVKSACLLVLLSGVCNAQEPAAVTRDQLCVTNGDITTSADGHLAIETSSSRAVLPGATSQTAEIHFRYLGPSAALKPLASGELRQQIGIKLRAQDTCNLLYATWHIAPDGGLHVSVKRNPGEQTHAQCGAHGYINLKPERALPVAAIVPGQAHTLRAELNGTTLKLTADGAVAWEGSVGNDIKAIAGPVGLRTDNARFVLDYFTAIESGSQTPATAHCETSAGD